MIFTMFVEFLLVVNGFLIGSWFERDRPKQMIIPFISIFFLMIYLCGKH